MVHLSFDSIPGAVFLRKMIFFFVNHNDIYFTFKLRGKT